MDGIDVALIETDGENVFSLGPACTVPYTPKLEQLIRNALGDRANNPELIRDITDAHAVAVSVILSQHPEFKNKITMVGLHGHTVAHLPNEGITIQIGDGARLAEKTGFDVVYDFRAADVAAGGGGSPCATVSRGAQPGPGRSTRYRKYRRHFECHLGRPGRGRAAGGVRYRAGQCPARRLGEKHY